MPIESHTEPHIGRKRWAGLGYRVGRKNPLYEVSKNCLTSTWIQTIFLEHGYCMVIQSFLVGMNISIIRLIGVNVALFNAIRAWPTGKNPRKSTTYRTLTFRNEKNRVN